MLVTVVRSMVGAIVELPGPIFIRPWALVEVRELSDEMRAVLKVLIKSRVVQVGQVLNGAPLSDVRLDKENPLPPSIGKEVV